MFPSTLTPGIGLDVELDVEVPAPFEAGFWADDGFIGPDDLDDMSSADRAEAEAIMSMVPDTLDEIAMSGAVKAAFAAEQLVRIDRLWREFDENSRLERFSDPGIVLRSVRLELAAALRITEHAAESMLHLARSLVHDYPDALDSLARSRITETHARIMIDQLARLPQEERAALAPRALEFAEQYPTGAFRRSLKGIVDRALRDSLAQRQAAQLEQRRVCVELGDDGMAWLSAYIPAVEAQAIHHKLTLMGKAIKAEPGEERSLDQIRADAFCDLLIDGTVEAHPDAARGIRASVVVTVPVLSLLDDEHAASADPATVEGIGPIPIGRARVLCGSASGWMRVLTHPETGMVLSAGRKQYRPPESLRNLVKWRADRCMAPGCGIPASRCEIDHTVAWEDGGETSLANHAPLCTGHHTIKHHGNWYVEQIPDSGGALLWRSPTGREYRTKPERKVPVFTAVGEPPPF